MQSIKYSNWCPSELFVSYFQSEVECWKETNKVLIFKFGEDLSYFVILLYKLHVFIKIYDDYVFVNGPIKGDFQKTLLLFHMGRKSVM